MAARDDETRAAPPPRDDPPTRREALRRGALTAGSVLVYFSSAGRAGAAARAARPGEVQEGGVEQKRSGREGIALFNGQDLEGWTDTKGEKVTKGWVVEDGCLHRAGPGGDLLSTKEYADFDLHLEWKIAKAGNSGVKYRVKQYGTSWLGPEYQLLDDAGHENGKVEKTSAASLYDVFAPNPAEKELAEPGEWNHTRIVVRGTHFEHWLNGHLVLTCDTDGEAWQAAVEKSKFAKLDGFAKNPRGRILLQDHGDEVWFRNLRLFALPPQREDDGQRVTTLALGEEGGVPR